MGFDLSLRYSTPLTPIADVDEVLGEFLRLVGYLPNGEEGRGSEGPVGESLAYRLVRQCFLGEPSRAWQPDELAVALKTTRPTVYRHINKLKSLDLLEEVGVPSRRDHGGGRKAYRLRYGNIARAWDFTEAHAQNALRRYRETVNHLQTLIDQGAAVPPAAKTVPRAAARGGGR